MEVLILTLTLQFFFHMQRAVCHSRSYELNKHNELQVAEQTRKTIVFFVLFLIENY